MVLESALDIDFLQILKFNHNFSDGRTRPYTFYAIWGNRVTYHADDRSGGDGAS
jgi:hypothetical protein